MSGVSLKSFVCIVAGIKLARLFFAVHIHIVCLLDSSTSSSHHLSSMFKCDWLQFLVIGEGVGYVQLKLSRANFNI